LISSCRKGVGARADRLTTTFSSVFLQCEYL